MAERNFIKKEKPDFSIESLQEPKCLFVEETESMRACVKIFNNKNIGALLVLGGPLKNKLVGIITERDILNNFFKLSEPNALDYSVKKYMTPDPITVPIGKLKDAAQIMIKNGFRHVVFTINSKNNDEHVAGIISMRDLFKEFIYGNSSKLIPYGDITEEVALISASDDSKRIFRSIFSKLTQSKLTLIDSQSIKLEEKLKKNQHLFFDLDRESGDRWSQLLKTLLHLKNRPKKITLLYNPLAFDQKTLRTIEKVSDSAQISLIEKPLDVGLLLASLKKN
jgi:CBS domain-containing protein